MSWLKVSVAFGLGLFPSLTAPAITTQFTVPLPTIEKTTYVYDADIVQFASDNALTESKSSGDSASLFGPLAGLDAAKGATKGLVDLTEHRAAHILNRHRAGAGISGKTEFPAGWSDKNILHHVSDVATDPRSTMGVGKWNSPYAIGTRDGVTIRVDFYPPNHPNYAGKISTAYPINVAPNP